MFFILIYPLEATNRMLDFGEVEMSQQNHEYHLRPRGTNEKAITRRKESNAFLHAKNRPTAALMAAAAVA
eukprot:SAG11_NODE_19731_length_459_cov_0.648199_1_plen_70_part_00